MNRTCPHCGTPLPEKPIVITFDDGYYNNYLNVFPLLQEYQAKAVISIIGKETDRYSQLDENKENYENLLAGRRVVRCGLDVLRRF